MWAMNTLDAQRQAQVIASLIEGNSIRATCRMTGVAKGTVLSLLARVGAACAAYQDKTLRHLPCQRVQCDEIWAFCYAKSINVPKAKQGRFGYGDVWTWTAIDADTKPVPCWRVGRRDWWTGWDFLKDLASRMAGRVQITTDGHRAYRYTVQEAFGSQVDFAILHKLYGSSLEGERRYSPPHCLGAHPHAVAGTPDPKHISTSFVERQNLTMRMSMRRFTRLTNGFSKKVDNLAHAVALHFMAYNFCRVHQTLKQTPAMAAGVATRVWTVQDIIGLLESN
ncbi:MAG: transposase [Omnitrophica WOR_2 bacterium RIFCSPHIGHO2_02_FULL_68_15]|nr:MAG: transposase [Omnitrophica WOR_2 bacterium RIFCSPHIGHO2_02_FULL_68_15]